jgi:5S rRNA maturation endonuclease (ribonuclease M5)
MTKGSRNSGWEECEMRYTFFEFENFKGIGEARLDLSPSASAARVYTLVGLNESGKTTVLQAIDHFQPTNGQEVSPKQLGGWVAPDPHVLIPIAERANFNGDIVIRCGIELDDDDVEAAKAHLRQVDGYRLVDMDHKIEIADKYTYENSRFKGRQSIWSGLAGTGRGKSGGALRQLTHRRDNDRWNELARFVRSILPTIWFFPNFLFEFPEKIYIEEYDDETDSNRFYRALFQDVLDALERDLETTKHVVERARSAKPSDTENLQQVLLEASRDVTTTVVGAWNHIFRDKPIAEKSVRIDLGQDPQSGFDPSGQPKPSKLWVRFRLEDNDGLFSIGERSLGFRWFFVYLMITTYRGQRKGGSKDLLFLFDEPASNLHPTAQHALLSSLRDLSKKAVIIYATHSHHLIEPAWLGTTYVVANEGLDPESVSADYTARSTDIRITPYRQFAAQHPDQSHFFQPILDVLDYAPSDLELVPEVVMVEGKSDFHLLAYYQEVLRKLPRNQRLHILPGGGAGTLDDVIQLYLAWSRPFIALLDSDRAGRSQMARYVEKFGEIIAPHLIELAAASGNKTARGVESLLTDGDKLALQRVADPSSPKYQKKALWLGVQEALLTQTKVKLSESATAALGRTVASLRERLSRVTAEMNG